MAIWMIPANSSIYNHEASFQKNGFIDWRQKANYEIGDIIYIYCTYPLKKVVYKCEATHINKMYNECADDKEFWNIEDEYEKRKEEKFVRFKLLMQKNSEKLTLEKLLQNGLIAAPQGPMRISDQLSSYLETIFQENNEMLTFKINDKRVQTKKDWIDILESEEQENNIILETLFYMMSCNNHTSSIKNISKVLETEDISLQLMNFGKRIINQKKISEQLDEKGEYRYWNIPFTTDSLKNKSGIIKWKVRDELAEALIQKYNLIDNNINIENLFKEYIEFEPPEKYESKIIDEVNLREEFTSRFNINYIMNMMLNDYVTGRSSIDDFGKNSFCYLLEFKMMQLGDMRGATVEKFGVWYSKDEKKYNFLQKYGETIDSAFSKIKHELCKLIVAGNNDDYKTISDSLLPPLFKGKVLSTYFPEKYLCIFKEDDVDKFLNILGIDYDMHIEDTIEKKKRLLKMYKNNTKLFRDYSDYYFVLFLYTTFKNEIKEKHTVNGEIDYNIKIVDFKYKGAHVPLKKESFRSRTTDYEKINRNKKNIGNRGEHAVLKYEKKRLLDLGLQNLSDKVELCENDSMGYDITSYNDDGSERHIEVKTNSSKNDNIVDFYLSDNELSNMLSDSNYYIYYLFNIKSKPKMHIINKENIIKERDSYLKPILYKVSIDVEEK